MLDNHTIYINQRATHKNIHTPLMEIILDHPNPSSLLHPGYCHLLVVIEMSAAMAAGIPVLGTFNHAGLVAGRDPTKNCPWPPPGWGLGVGPITPPCQKRRMYSCSNPRAMWHIPVKSQAPGFRSQTYLLHPILLNIISLVSWKTNWQISKLPQWRFRYFLKEPHSWPSKQAHMHVHTLAWKMSRKVIYSTMNQCQQWIKSVMCQPINKLTVRCDRMSFFTDTTRQQHGILSSNKRN